MTDSRVQAQIPGTVLVTDEPLTIAAWAKASSTRRTAIARPPQPLTRCGSRIAQSTAVIHWRIKPYSAAAPPSPTGGRVVQVACVAEAKESLPLTKATDFRTLRSAGAVPGDRARMPGDRRSRKPLQAPEATASRTSVNCQPGQRQHRGWPCVFQSGPGSVTGPIAPRGRPVRAQHRAELDRRGGGSTGRRSRRARPPRCMTNMVAIMVINLVDQRTEVRRRTRSAGRSIPRARWGAQRPPPASSSEVADRSRQPPLLCLRSQAG